MTVVFLQVIELALLHTNNCHVPLSGVIGGSNSLLIQKTRVYQIATIPIKVCLLNVSI